MQRGVRGHRLVEGFQVAVAQLLRGRQHLRLDARHFRKAQLMDLLRRHVGGGGRLGLEGIAVRTLRQRPHAH
ncbi:conserved hypothetical protein, partial [Ricinus communis]